MRKKKKSLKQRYGAGVVGSNDLQVWTVRDLDVYYRETLDGGGSQLCHWFLKFIKENYGQKRFKRVYEWCSGPGFIGFTMLAHGICEELCLADVNPQAIECIEKTVKMNGLEKSVSVYLSDNLHALPETEKFDLVLGAPPNYFRLNPRHPLYALYKDDLRPNDRGWKLHRGFYTNIRKHLNPGAPVVIMEVNTHSDRVYLGPPDEPAYDLRNRAPIIDYKRMIKSGGLKFEGDYTLYALPGEPRFSFVVSVPG